MAVSLSLQYGYLLFDYHLVQCTHMRNVILRLGLASPSSDSDIPK